MVHNSSTGWHTRSASAVAAAVRFASARDASAAASSLCCYEMCGENFTDWEFKLVILKIIELQNHHSRCGEQGLQMHLMSSRVTTAERYAQEPAHITKEWSLFTTSLTHRAYVMV